MRRAEATGLARGEVGVGAGVDAVGEEVAAGLRRTRRRGRGHRAHQDVERQHGQEQPGDHQGGGTRPAAHEAPPVARPVSSSAQTLMPSWRKADATRARSSRPTSNCTPGSVRATMRTENVSTSIFSTPITVGGSSIILRSRSSL